jgi:hypothetical protein
VAVNRGFAVHTILSSSGTQKKIGHEVVNPDIEDRDEVEVDNWAILTSVIRAHERLVLHHSGTG